MRDDTEIRRDVESELQWDPSVDDSKIKVFVHDGVVTLTGVVGTLAGKWAAENVTKRIIGVRAIANDIETKPHSTEIHHDTDIAQAVVKALRWNVATSSSAIQSVVKDGCVTLSGKVQWGFQKTSAEHAVHALPGVTGIINDILVSTTQAAKEVKRKIDDALHKGHLA